LIRSQPFARRLCPGNPRIRPSGPRRRTIASDPDPRPSSGPGGREKALFDNPLSHPLTDLIGIETSPLSIFFITNSTVLPSGRSKTIGSM